jgi:hypothetical protein
LTYGNDEKEPRAVAVHHSGTASCGNYGAGHDPHWIQVLRVAPRGTPVQLHDVRLIDPVRVELDVDSRDGNGRETLVRFNHDAVQVSTTWQRCGAGRYVHGASLLQIGSASGAASFSVAAGGLGPCGSSVREAGGAR